MNGVKEYLSQNETYWGFIPPRNPQCGEIWESATKTAEYHLSRSMGNWQLTFEELSYVIFKSFSIPGLYILI